MKGPVVLVGVLRLPARRDGSDPVEDEDDDDDEDWEMQNEKALVICEQKVGPKLMCFGLVRAALPLP